MAKRGPRPYPGILTPREEEVLALLRLKLTNPEIAERLGITLDGAKYHVGEILSKLGVSSREKAARWRPESEDRPWWATALAPVALLWRKAAAAMPVAPGTAALALSGGMLVATLGVLAFIAFLLARGDGSDRPGEAASLPEATPVVGERDAGTSECQFEWPPLVNYLPRTFEEPEEVSRSHLIVIGRYTREIGKEFLPLDLGPNVTPGPNEPEVGIPTTKYVFEVERYIKGKALNDDDTQALRATDWDDHTALDERVLLLLVPSWEGTYQAGIWTSRSEKDGAVRFLTCDVVPEAEGMTLDEYADRLQGIADAQRVGGPPTDLVKSFPPPGEAMTPAHYLALWMTESVEVTEQGHIAAELSGQDVAAFVAAGEIPVEVEEGTVPPAARTVRIVISLEDGHVWELEYDPLTGVAVHTAPDGQVYPGTGFQAQLVPEMQAIIAKYLD